LAASLLATSLLWFSLSGTGSRRRDVIAPVVLAALATLLPFFTFLYGFLFVGDYFIKINTHNLAPFFLALTSAIIFALFLFWSPMVVKEETPNLRHVAMQKHQTSLPITLGLLVVFLSITFLISVFEKGSIEQTARI